MKKFLLLAAVLLAAVTAYFAYISFRELDRRVIALTRILENRLLDETLLACNKAAQQDDRAERFERSKLRRFQLVPYELGTGDYIGFMQIHMGNLVCTHSFRGGARVEVDMDKIIEDETRRRN